MSSAICREVAFQTTLGITVALQKAPVYQLGGLNVSQHTLPDYTITLGTAAVAGDTSIQISVTNLPSGQTDLYLDAGTVLAFSATPNPIKVTLATSATITATPSAVTVLPVSAAIASAATATTKALLFVPGCRSAVLTPTIKNEDVTNFLSGTGMEMVTTGNSKKLGIEIDLVYNNKAHDAILSAMYADADVGRQFYLQVAFPSGENHEGYALLTTATPTTAVQAKRSVTTEWQFQGGCYFYTPAPLVAA